MGRAFSRQVERIAAPAGVAVRFAGEVLPGLVGLGSVAYGAWLWWPPAGFMVAGVLLLADRAWEQARAGRGAK